MKLFLSVFVFAGICALSVGIVIEYSYHNTTNLTWGVAQWYCKTYYKDLATVNDSSEEQTIANLGYEPFSGWIGLYRINLNPDTWKWSDNTAVSFTSWNGEPTSDNTHNCCSVYAGQWYNDYCGSTHAYYCYRFLILVNQNKTWEDAFHYCKTNYTGLAALPMPTQVAQAKVELALSQTASVWTGLRFLNGQWFWMNGELLKTPDSLASCPAQPYRCGALNANTNNWENRNCNEKLNFLCWK